MSTCPSKDLHSVYLDNELPLSYVKEYENHVKNCPKCTAELQKLKNLREFFQEDSKSIKFSEQDLDKSYERLLTRMSYHKNTNKTQNVFTLGRFNSTAKYIFTGIAAAAVIAVILPVRLKNNAPQNIASNQNFEPIQRPLPNSSFSDFSRNNQILSGSTASFGNATDYGPNNFNGFDAPPPLPPDFYGRKFENQRPFENPSYNENFNKQSLTEKPSLVTYDLFCPLPNNQGTFNSAENENNLNEFSFELSPDFADLSLEQGNETR